MDFREGQQVQNVKQSADQIQSSTLQNVCFDCETLQSFETSKDEWWKNNTKAGIDFKVCQSIYLFYRCSEIETLPSKSNVEVVTENTSETVLPPGVSLSWPLVIGPPEVT